MTRIGAFCAAFLLLTLLSLPAYGASCASPAWGASVGATGTADDDLYSPSLAANGSFECFGNPKVRPHFSLGVANLEADIGPADTGTT